MDAVPVSVVSDAADVSIVPEVSTPGTPTEATVLVCVIPGVDVHPRLDNAERPDWTAPLMATVVPYPVAW
jgi:hypothetical protein